jgi:hypothetical protein
MGKYYGITAKLIQCKLVEKERDTTFDECLFD